MEKKNIYYFEEKTNQGRSGQDKTESLGWRASKRNAGTWQGRGREELGLIIVIFFWNKRKVRE